jgi:ferredoxin
MAFSTLMLAHWPLLGQIVFTSGPAIGPNSLRHVLKWTSFRSPEGWLSPMIASSGKPEAEVSFPEQEQQVRVMVGRTLLDGAHAARLEISNVCAGRGICGKCRVIVTGGSEKLSPITDLERISLSQADIEQGFRIGCLARIKCREYCRSNSAPKVSPLHSNCW